jgi:hypothetical protein
MTRVRLTTIIIVTLLATCAAIARAETADELPSFLNGEWVDAPRVSLSVDTSAKTASYCLAGECRQGSYEVLRRMGDVMMAVRIASSPDPVDLVIYVEDRDNINIEVGGSIYSLARPVPKGGARR